MTAIAAGSPDKLDVVIATQMAAAKAGELDGALEGHTTPLADQIALRQGP